MKLWVYTFCWNEERMIPFFLRHYNEWLCAERIVVYDNESDDRSIDLLEAASYIDIEIRPYCTNGKHAELSTMSKIRGECWREARGQADWVAIVDMDEFIFHHDFFGFLERCMAKNVSIVRSYGFEMVSQVFPDDNGHSQLWELVPNGVQYGTYSKPCLFQPGMLERLDFSVGAHDCQARGTVNWLASGALRMLHFKHLGWDYFWKRTEKLRERTCPIDVDNDVSVHYRYPMQRHWDEYHNMLRHAVDVIT
jgi:hypothetical protein